MIVLDIIQLGIKEPGINSIRILRAILGTAAYGEEEKGE
jgi:hypothetical protein